MVHFLHTMPVEVFMMSLVVIDVLIILSMVVLDMFTLQGKVWSSSTAWELSNLAVSVISTMLSMLSYISKLVILTSVNFTAEFSSCHAA